MPQNVMNGSDTVTVSKKDLYDIVKLAVYDAITNLDFITVNELRERELALKELEEDGAVTWNDYLNERGVTA